VGFTVSGQQRSSAPNAHENPGRRGDGEARRPRGGGTRPPSARTSRPRSQANGERHQPRTNPPAAVSTSTFHPRRESQGSSDQARSGRSQRRASRRAPSQQSPHIRRAPPPDDSANVRQLTDEIKSIRTPGPTTVPQPPQTQWQGTAAEPLDVAAGRGRTSRTSATPRRHRSPDAGADGLAAIFFFFFFATVAASVVPPAQPEDGFRPHRRMPARRRVCRTTDRLRPGRKEHRPAVGCRKRAAR